MAHDRYDNRDERPRWQGERFEGRGRGRDEDRGFFERAGDEVASWFGDEEAERRRREDLRDEGRDRGWNRDERPRFYGRDRFERDEDRRPRFPSGDRFERDEDRDYGREPGNQLFAASGYARGGFGPGDFERERGRSWRAREPLGRDEYRRRGFFGADRSRDFDPHYSSWRQRQMDELDRDYDDYRRENQSRFEDDFTSWRQRRLGKRQMLTTIREHMEVIGSDDVPVGTIDRIAGDRIILAKSDPESGGVHHSLSCADVGRIEGDKVILDCTGEQAKQRWRDESRDRALFEREDQGDMGDRILDRSFEGTYR